MSLQHNDTPPETLEALRALLMAISKGDSPILLGAKAKIALAKMLELQGNPALLSITSLSEAIGTSPSTITRLARSLGYANFGQLQQVLIAPLAHQPGAFYLSQAQSALNSADQPIKQRAAQLCHENQANIDRFIESFDTKSFTAAVELIANAPRVTVYGIRQFHSLATFLAYGLRLIRSDVSVLDANGLGTAEELSTMGSTDVCLVASVAPYSNQVIEVAKVAAEHHINVISITDRISSPLVPFANVSLFAAHQSSFISNSITSFFAIAECLINATASATANEAKQSLIHRQQMIKRLGIEDR